MRIIIFTFAFRLWNLSNQPQYLLSPIEFLILLSFENRSYHSTYTVSLVLCFLNVKSFEEQFLCACIVFNINPNNRKLSTYLVSASDFIVSRSNGGNLAVASYTYKVYGKHQMKRSLRLTLIRCHVTINLVIRDESTFTDMIPQEMSTFLLTSPAATAANYFNKVSNEFK